jgi:hypothetical protein
MPSKAAVLLILLSLAALGAPARAEDVEVVLSADLAAYREALAGFKEAFGGPFAARAAGEARPAGASDAKVVVAFGAKAARDARGDGAFFIYGLVPGARVPPPKGARGASKVWVAPEPHRLVAEVRRLQPSLRRLLVVWVVPHFAEYARQLARAGAPLGVEIVECGLESREQLPDCLRAWGSGVDALWLAPDPFLICEETALTARSFSWSNKIPVYVSVEGLLDKGATVSVAAKFRAMGRAAGKIARDALEGKEVPEAVYAEEFETQIDARAAARAGLESAR